MTSILQPNSISVLLCSIVFIISGVIILSALRKFKMKVAYSLFSVFFFIIGIYIPFYFLGTLLMNSITFEADSSFSYFFIQKQLAVLNSPFVLFQSISLLFGVIGLVALIAVIIAIAFVIKTAVESLLNSIHKYFIYIKKQTNQEDKYLYIPNYQYIYIRMGRFRI